MSTAVGQLLYLLDEAFAGEDWHSLRRRDLEQGDRRRRAAVAV